jgi:hypothetical protein
MSTWIKDLIKAAKDTEYANTKIGHVEVTARLSYGGPEFEVEVSWPSIGAVDPDAAFTFANDMAKAAKLAFVLRDVLNG